MRRFLPTRRMRPERIVSHHSPCMRVGTLSAVSFFAGILTSLNLRFWELLGFLRATICRLIMQHVATLFPCFFNRLVSVWAVNAALFRGSRDPGRRRRSRPTLTTPRESVPRRTGRGRHRTSFRNCQGLFSRPRMIPSANSCRSSRSVPLLLASSLAEARRRRRHRSEFSQRKLSAAPYLPVAICCFHRLIRW